MMRGYPTDSNGLDNTMYTDRVGKVAEALLVKLGTGLIRIGFYFADTNIGYFAYGWYFGCCCIVFDVDITQLSPYALPECFFSVIFCHANFAFNGVWIV